MEPTPNVRDYPQFCGWLETLTRKQQLQLCDNIFRRGIARAKEGKQSTG